MQPTVLLESGRYYHLYNRGNNGENVFIEERNYTYFMNLYAKYVDPVAETYAYSKAINRAYGRTGSLFENRFRRKEVTTDRYFQRLIHYIHWNPQKHGFVADFRDYPYSSYHLFLIDKPTFVKRIEVLGWFGGRDDFVRQHHDYADEKDLQDVLLDEDE